MAKGKQNSKATFHIYSDEELLNVVEVPLVEPKRNAPERGRADNSANRARSDRKRKSA